MANGCSGALEMCLQVLGSEGQDILIPRPGFALYRTLAESQGLRVKTYNLLPESGWQVDLQHLESIADKNTVAICKFDILLFSNIYQFCFNCGTTSCSGEQPV